MLSSLCAPAPGDADIHMILELCLGSELEEVLSQVRGAAGWLGLVFSRQAVC